MASAFGVLSIMLLLTVVCREPCANHPSSSSSSVCMPRSGIAGPDGIAVFLNLYGTCPCSVARLGRRPLHQKVGGSMPEWEATNRCCSFSTICIKYKYIFLVFTEPPHTVPQWLPQFTFPPAGPGAPVSPQPRQRWFSGL